MNPAQAAPAAPPGALRWDDAVKALWAFALDPVLLGGVWLRAPHGPVRDRRLAEMAALGSPGVRIPTHVDDERLLGGLDLSASLRSGSTVAQSGLLQRAHGHWVVLPMAERMRANTLARLVQAQDRGEVHALHVGNQAAQACAFGVVALDESLDDEPPLPSALCDRLSLWLDLRDVSWTDVGHRALGTSPWADDNDNDIANANATPAAGKAKPSDRQPTGASVGPTTTTTTTTTQLQLQLQLQPQQQAKPSPAIGSQPARRLPTPCPGTCNGPVSAWPTST